MVDGPRQPKKRVKRNFVAENKVMCRQRDVMKQVDKMYPDPLHFLTLPLEGETDSGFTRAEIIDFYILFKTLCKLSLLEAVVNGDQHPVIGVNESTFRNYIKQLCFEHDDMCARFFEVANTEKDGYLDWYQFFEAMKILKTTDLKTKIDSGTPL